MPDTWSIPFARFSLDPASCPASHFKNMRLVIDLTLCGDLGNPTFAKSCPEAGQLQCEEWVATQRLSEAYWLIQALDVYQWSGVREQPSLEPHGRTPVQFFLIALFLLALAVVVILFVSRLMSIVRPEALAWRAITTAPEMRLDEMGS